MDNSVLDNPPTDRQERLARLQAELEGQQLTTLLEKLMEHFELSASQVAESAGIDPSALHKILQGENREFKAEHVDNLLDDLETLGKLTDPAEKTIWHRSLRIAAFQYFELYKATEIRLRKIPNPAERVQFLAEYLRNQYPALAETYDRTKGQFPALVPLADVIARQWLQRWGWIRVPEGYQLRSVGADSYTLISTDLFPKTITDLGPELEVKSTGFGTYVVRRKTVKPSAPRQNEQPREQTEQERGWVRQPWEPKMVYIPEGWFLMGSRPGSPLEFSNELPQTRLFLKGYWIGKYPVTNAQYKRFVEATGHKRPSHWEGGAIPTGKDDHPVVYVTWNDAVAYCKWLVQMTGKTYRLPSEAEWEKAARGPDGREYPWGNVFDASKCNVHKSGVGTTTPVGHYSPRGDSPYGCADMAGNVWEWTSSLYKAYPYKADDGREDMSSSGSRVLRGGSFLNFENLARVVARDDDGPGSGWNYNGFRCGVSGALPISLE